MKKLVIIAIAFAVFALNIQSGMAGTNTMDIFKKKCAMCHALHKKKFGPAFSNMNKDPAVLKLTITNGRKSMPAFGKKLSVEEIDAMVTFVQSKPTK